MRLKRMESNYAAGMARFERWRMKFEAEISEDMAVRALRRYVMSMTPVQMAMLAKIDPKAFEDMMKLVRGG